jgi:hypothetical protein
MVGLSVIKVTHNFNIRIRLPRRMASEVFRRVLLMLPEIRGTAYIAVMKIRV